MTIYSLAVYWPSSPISVGYQAADDELTASVPLGAMIPSPSTGGAVDSVNGMDGAVVLDAAAVGADVAGTAAAVQAALAPQIADLSNNKLDAVDYVQHYLGTFPSYSALTNDHPTARPGDEADIDGGADFGVMRAIWDNSDQEWVVRDVNNIQNTDHVPEGNSNLYFTGPRVRSTPLTGLAAGTNTSILATDELLVAFAKLQAQINAQTVITWETPALSTGYASGFTDLSNPLQIGKGSDGCIYIRGVIRNTSGSTNNNVFLVLPTTHYIKGYTNTSFTQFTLAAPRMQAMGSSLGPFNVGFTIVSTVQQLNPSSALTNTSVWQIPPAVLGIALNP